MKQLLLISAMVAGLAGQLAHAAAFRIPAKSPRKLTELRRANLPETPLRGYGSLAGQYIDYRLPKDLGTGSILLIDCADDAKAALTLGKYRSDLRSLGGVTESTLALQGKTVPLALVDNLGAVLALREKKTVLVASAANADAIASLLHALEIKLPHDLDSAGAPVPDFLNKYDKWGFCFWCHPPVSTPRGQQQTYDLRRKFEWARKMGVGLQINMSLNATGGAGGILEDKSRLWALDLAREMGIPVTIQTQGALTPRAYANRFADEMLLKVPQLIGNYYRIGGYNQVGASQHDILGWVSTAGKDQLFADLYQCVERYGQYPNVLGYVDWHGEVERSAYAKFHDYGPVADARYRDYLEEQYKTPQALDQRWFGGKGVIRKWEEIRLPEPAEFLGWNEQAIDLKGPWRRSILENVPGAWQAKWDAQDLDDSAWATIVAPGDDRQVFREKRNAPTIFRRSLQLSDEQLAQLKPQGKTWLYVWPAERGYRHALEVGVNGTRLPAAPYKSPFPWGAFEIGKLLVPGSNLIALNIPKGSLNYRAYLSSSEPRCYPDLGPERNAQWVDYCDFIEWLRADGLRRSTQAIRRRDPDKPIKFMTAHDHTDVVKAISEDYGCYWHDTGGMSGWWNDRLPALARSSGLPVSLEPGNPAYDLPTLKRDFGYWLTEGLNAVDYFMDIGDVMWRPDQKAWFEAHLPLVHLIGKFHAPRADVAVMEGTRSKRLTGFPWDSVQSDLNWNRRWHGLSTLYQLPNPRDMITERDFFSGNAERYKVIVDDATLVMEPALVDRIDAWVRAGGIFVVQGHSGRHTPTQKNAWLINRLTGYKVVGFNDNSRVKPVDGQPIFTDPVWSKIDVHGRPVVGGAGVYLEKVAPECQNILQWHKGAIAAGVRPLGKGKVITLGTPLSREVPTAWPELLAWCGIEIPAAPSAPGCRTAHWVSNNGLYDVYVVFAQNVKQPKSVAFSIPGPQTVIRDLRSGALLTGTAKGAQVEFADFKVEPMETYVFIAPRRLADAPLEWLSLQRDWWKGTRLPGPAPRVRPWNNTLSLDQDWAFQPLENGLKQAKSLAGAEVDDTGWDRMDIGVWYGKKYPTTTCGLFRKRFTVPANWLKSGHTWLWLRGPSPGRPTMQPCKLAVFLDGKPAHSEHHYIRQEITDWLTPGEHTLAVATESQSVLGGILGNVWLEHIPEPAARQSLAGDWNGVKLPGTAPTMRRDQVRRTFTLDPSKRGKRAVFYFEAAGNNMRYIMLNGRMISKDLGGGHFLMDLTPYVHWDKPNDISLYPQYETHSTHVKTVEIRYYEPGQL
jgi:hypothetical protein